MEEKKKTELVTECKYCGSKALYLQSKIEGQDVATADMVSLKCAMCDKWLGWCSKKDRKYYIGGVNFNKEEKVEEIPSQTETLKLSPK